MNTIKVIIISGLVAVLITSIVNSYNNPEAVTARAKATEIQIELNRVKAEIKSTEQRQRHLDYLEREASKSNEQKIIEAQAAATTDIGEAVLGAAAISGGVYILGKMLDY